jgi:hypothetical protein
MAGRFASAGERPACDGKLAATSGIITRMDDPLTGEPTSNGVLFVRYGLPAVLILAGFVCYAVAPESNRNEGFALFVGSGVSVLLLNLLYRMGVSGDADRDRENEAREYFSEHGAWPDEERERRPSE